MVQLDQSLIGCSIDTLPLVPADITGVVAITNSDLLFRFSMSWTVLFVTYKSCIVSILSIVARAVA